MDHENNHAECSNKTTNQDKQIENNKSVTSVASREIFSHILNECTNPDTSRNNEENIILEPSRTSIPLVLLTKPSHSRKPLCISSNLPSVTSLIMPEKPLTLFLQALAKLNESSISLAIPKNLNTDFILKLQNTNEIININSSELSPPDSLTSAPPSYSFVLRQMATRRRPRLMGTFIPSPSFVQHTPPPNYTTAFDIYVDSPIPPPPRRTYNFGFTPMPIVCPECGYAGMTMVSSKITLCTHLCAVIMCLLCCWICAPLPYVLKSCKDVYHYCRNCRNYLGMYCPTNPESAYS